VWLSIYHKIHPRLKLLKPCPEPVERLVPSEPAFGEFDGQRGKRTEKARGLKLFKPPTAL